MSSASNLAVSVNLSNQVSPIPSSFWGMDVSSQRNPDAITTLLPQTPIVYERYPGGIVGEETNYRTNIEYPYGKSSLQSTNWIQNFTKDCKATGCQAIIQLPLEINSPSTAAYEAVYIENNLSFKPAYWELGNEPAGWECFDRPWTEWSTCGTSPSTTLNTTPAAYAAETAQYIEAIQEATATANYGNIPFICLGGTGQQGAAPMVSWIAALVANSTDAQHCSGFSIHAYPASHGGTPSLSQLYGYLTATNNIVYDYQSVQALLAKESSPATIFFDEMGMAASGSIYATTYNGNWTEWMFMSAEIVQALYTHMPNVDWFRWSGDSADLILSPPGTAQTGYWIYQDLFDELGTYVADPAVEGTNGVFAVATTSSAVGSPAQPWEVLLVNTQVTSDVTVDLAGSGVPEYYSASISNWTSSGTVNSTVGELTDGLALAPQSVTLVTITPLQTVTFTESGLPSGVTWYVNVSGQAPLSITTTGSGGTTLATLLRSSTYSFTVASNDKRWAPAYTSTFTVGGLPVSVAVTFTLFTHDVTFAETNLPSSLAWSVTVDGAPMTVTTDGGTDSLIFAEANGTHTYAITDISGWHQMTLAYSGSVVVNGASVTEPPLVYAPVTYSVTLSESTLPSSLSWSIMLNGATRSITTDGGTDTLTGPGLANGTYSYSIADISGWHQATVPYSGTLTVNGGTGPIDGTGVGYAVTLLYTPVTYSVTFSESGLPSDLTWSATFNSVTMSLSTDGSTDTLIWTGLTNGTYAYSIAGNTGYHQNTIPYSGTETVGDPVAVSVSYAQITYGVTFSESGLSPGQTWSMTFHGVTRSLTTDGGTDPLTFAETNGTPAYAITDVSGWHQTTLAYSGSVVVNGASVTEPTLVYTPVTYSVAFSESGLPSGLTWQVTVNGVTVNLLTDGSTDSLTWTGLANGTYAYSILDIPGWHQATLAYSGSIAVNGGTSPIDGTGVGYAVTLVYTPVTYSVTFSESGLRSGLTWSVTFNSVAMSLTTDGGTDSLTFTGLANGTHAYSIGAISGWPETTLPYHGNIGVNGASVTEPTLIYTQVTYTATLTESGLPSGTMWSVTIGSQTLSSVTNKIGFQLGNGTYSYTVGVTPGYRTTPTGSFTVSGASVGVGKKFSVTTYTVKFTESGLPSGTSWSATLTPSSGPATTKTSTTGTITFAEPNGTYAYSIAAISGYHITTGSYTGSVTVNGANPATIAVHWTQVKYTVTFTETKLKAGTKWSVTIGTLTKSTTGSSMSFSLANGTYAFTITANGYTATSGTPSPLVVNGATVTVNVTFAAGSGSSSGSAAASGIAVARPNQLVGTTDWDR